MIAILRQYAIVLWVIVSRPWMLLMLGLGLVHVGPFLGAWIVGRAVPDGVMTAVPVVERSSGVGREELGKSALEGRLASVTKIDTKAERSQLSEYQIFIDEDGQIAYLGNGGRDGGWNVLDLSLIHI